MEAQAEKRELAKTLQAKINRMQGLGKLSEGLPEDNLLPFSNAFPGHIFPKGAVHEFISYEPAESASTSGFISAIAGKFMKEGSLCLWIGNERSIFPCGLQHFGIEPDRIVFINAPKPKEALWIIEEALKCEALTAVVGQIKELSFTDSRRLQLAVERSGVSCFIHRHQPRVENAVACTTKWKITPLASTIEGDLPGLGYASWDVQLLKVRNGKPDSWKVSWKNKTFASWSQKLSDLSTTERHAV